MRVEEHIPLAPYTTFKIGGPARFFIQATTVDELQQSLDWAREKNQKVLILGGGSNMLIGDSGFDGLVIKIDIKGIEVADAGPHTKNFSVGAGESWDALVARAVADGLWGIENLSGIPGTVGAAPVQNIGAYGCELKDTLAWVEAIDTTMGTIARFDNTQCQFGYRTSVFKRTPGRYVVVRVALGLHTDAVPNTTYKDLADCSSCTLPQVRERVLEVRAAKFPDLAVEGTAGSFFLNPTVGATEAAALAARYPGLPQFAVEGGVKLSLAWILDTVLQAKGLTVGGARLYEKQPLVIVAARNTKAVEVSELAKKVKKEVQEKIGITLEEEVRIVCA